MVVDASALADMLLLQRQGDVVAAMLTRSPTGVHAPHLIDLEVMQVLRRNALAGAIDESLYRSSQRRMDALPLQRHAHAWLRPRIWALRHNFTAYDACYVALAEALGCPLLTSDARMAAAARKFITVECPPPN